MSGKGLPPSAESSGYALLDEQGITASEFQQQVAYQRALEGELNKTIESIDGVNAAVVHLAIPEKDVFTEEAEPPRRRCWSTPPPARARRPGRSRRS